MTLQHCLVRYVLSSLCFGFALGEVLTVFGSLDCTVDIGTLTVLCIPRSFYYCYVPCRSFMLTESSLLLCITEEDLSCHQLWLVGYCSNVSSTIQTAKHGKHLTKSNTEAQG